MNADKVSTSEWRRFHKVTPLASAGSFWLVLLFGLYQVASNLVENGGIQDLRESLRSGDIYSKTLYILGGVVLITLGLVVFSVISWRRKKYAINASGIHLRQGVFWRSHSHMRWDRLQSVEVKQTLFGRIFGFGSLQLTSAGASEDPLELGLLRLADCAKLRKEILQGLEAARSGDTNFFANIAAEKSSITTEEDTPEALLRATLAATSGETTENSLAIPVFDVDDEAGDNLIFSLPTGRLIGSRLLDMGSLLAVIFAAALLVVQVLDNKGGILGLLIVLIAASQQVVKPILKSYGTKVYLSPQGLRRRSGATTVVTRTYPPQRIHAVEVTQKILWKPLGWWQIEITAAGEKILENLSDTFVSVARRAEMQHLLWTILPQLGVEDSDALLEEAFRGRGSGKYFAGAPARARLFDPIGAPGRGIFANKRVIIMRSGRWGRSVSFTLQDHIQSHAFSTGPLQRPRSLASFSVHTIPGSTRRKVRNLDAHYLRQLWAEEEALAAQARSVGVSESLKEWKKRIGFSA